MVLEESGGLFEMVRERKIYKNTEMQEGMPVYASGIFREEKLVLFVVKMCIRDRRMADAAIRLWPQQEEGYLMKIRHGVMTKNPEQIGTVIGLLENNKVYLSPAARRTVDFWKENDETES